MTFREVDMEKIILKDKIYPELFKSLNENRIFDIKAIKKLDDRYDLVKKNSENIQKVFIAKVMLYSIDKLEKNESNNEEIDKIKKKYNKIIEYPENSDEIINKIESIKEKNLDEIILDIVINLIEGENNNENIIITPSEENFDKFIEKWNNLKLNLEEFKMNESMKEKFKIFFEKHENYKEFFKELKLSGKKKLKEIYDYIKHKVENYSKYEKRESLKQMGDEERSREGCLSQENNDDDDNFMNKKIPKEKMSLVFQKFIIEIDFSEENPNYTYKAGMIEDKIDIEDYEKVPYDEKQKEENKFIKYLNFINQVKKYINQIEGKIKCKTQVQLKLTHKNDNVDGDVEEVMCNSSFNYKNEYLSFVDDNVLKEGISSKKPGLIFLLNELCNDDYDENSN